MYEPEIGTGTFIRIYTFMWTLAIDTYPEVFMCGVQFKGLLCHRTVHLYLFGLTQSKIC